MERERERRSDRSISSSQYVLSIYFICNNTVIWSCRKRLCQDLPQVLLLWEMWLMCPSKPQLPQHTLWRPTQRCRTLILRNKYSFHSQFYTHRVLVKLAPLKEVPVSVLVNRLRLQWLNEPHLVLKNYLYIFAIFGNSSIKLPKCIANEQLQRQVWFFNKCKTQHINHTEHK